MSDPLSPAEGVSSFEMSLKNGIGGQYDTYGDDRTTVRVPWNIDLRDDIRSIASKSVYPSQTECEMILARESVSQVNKFMRDTGLSWLFPMKKLVKTIERRNEYKTSALSDYNSAVSSSNLQFQFWNEDRKSLSLLKETSRKLSTDSSDFGIKRGDRVAIGMCVVVSENPDIFSPPVVSECERTKTRIARQTGRIYRDMEHYLRKIAESLLEARGEGLVYEDFVDEILEMTEENYPDAYEIVCEELNNEEL